MSTQKEEKIYFGFFPDFEHPTILFFGGLQAFASFRDLFLELVEKVRTSIRLSEYPLFVIGNVEIVLRLLPKATGMKKINDNDFEWGLSTKECLRFADYFRGLTETPVDSGGGHQYLECDALDEVVVIASVGEYSVQFFKQHGKDMWGGKGDTHH